MSSKMVLFWSRLLFVHNYFSYTFLIVYFFIVFTEVNLSFSTLSSTIINYLKETGLYTKIHHIVWLNNTSIWHIMTIIALMCHKTKTNKQIIFCFCLFSHTNTLKVIQQLLSFLLVDEDIRFLSVEPLMFQKLAGQLPHMKESKLPDRI